MKKLNRGILIALEGIDGSGKSTLAQSLATHLGNEYPVLLTKQPGGTALGSHIRALVHARSTEYSPLAEYLLFAADRAQHAFEVLIPVLAEKKLIISDRLADSSIAYQAYGRNLDKKLLHQVNAWALQGVKPDVTLYISLDYETCLKRLKLRNKQLTAFEQENVDYFKRVIVGFEELYKKQDRKDVLILDGTQSPEELLNQATKFVVKFLGEI